jgi:hypothetical protein
VTLVWSWNIGKRSNTGTFPDSLGMTSYTLAILFFALKPILKKLLSIKIVIFHTSGIWEVLSEKYLSREVASNKLDKGPHWNNETVFSSLMPLRFWRRIFFNNLLVLEDVGLSMTLKWRSRSNLGHEFYNMCWADHLCKKEVYI